MADHLPELQSGLLGPIAAVIGEDNEEGQVPGVWGDTDIQLVAAFSVTLHSHFQFVFAFGGVGLDPPLYSPGDLKGRPSLALDVLGQQEGLGSRGSVPCVCSTQNIINGYVSLQLMREGLMALAGAVELEFCPGDLFMSRDGDVEKQDVFLEGEVFCGRYRDSI